MDPRFVQLAPGAEAVDIVLKHGGITVEDDPGGNWRLDYREELAGELLIERVGPLLRLYQRESDNAPRLDLVLRVPRAEAEAAIPDLPAGAVPGLRLSTGRGDLAVDTTWTAVAAKTGKGRVTLHALRATHLFGRTGHGDVSARAGQGPVELHTGSGRVELDGGAGDISAHTGHGDIHLLTGGAAVRVHSGSGKIQITANEARELRAHTGNGDLQVHAPLALIDVHSGNGRVTVEGGREQISARSGNGTVSLHAGTGRLDLKTGSGRIEVHDAAASGIEARSGSGDIRIAGGSIDSGRLDTGSGSIQCAVDRVAGRLEIVSGNGDLTLGLPESARAQLDLQTGSGHIDSAFPLVRVGRQGQPGSGSARMVGSLGSGDPEAVISMRTHRGRIRIQRLDSLPPAVTPTPAPPPASPAVPVVPRAAAMPPVPPVPAPPPPAAAPAPAASSDDPVLSVLNALAQGKISVDEAERRLAGAGGADR